MFRSNFTWLVGTALFGWVVLIGPFCWILKDGLGPDSRDSYGWDAAARFFMTFYWDPVMVVLALLTLAGVTWPRHAGSTAIPEAEDLDNE